MLLGFFHVLYLKQKHKNSTVVNQFPDSVTEIADMAEHSSVVVFLTWETEGICVVPGRVNMLHVEQSEP